ncbi:MAG: hypothetical protein GY816_11010 [Cytophagales bacterium]|nr:hypothetical protein [Cytophagales bacterium]
MERIEAIRKEPNVKSLTYMWECDFKSQCLENPEVGDFASRFNPSKAASKYESQEKIIDDLLDDTLTGKNVTNLLNTYNSLLFFFPGYILATVSIKKKFRAQLDHYPPFFKRFILLSI